MTAEGLRAHAERLGVATGFWDATGRWYDVSEATLRAVLDGMGAAEPPAAATGAAAPAAAGVGAAAPAAAATGATAPAAWPALVVAQQGWPWRWSPPAGEPLRLTLESGEERKLDDGRLPADLPFGYHELAGASGATRLAVAPQRCHLPSRLAGGGRDWGWAVQVYALRSRGGWGVGDLADLAELAADPELDAGFVLLNPLHAAAPGLASPYYPSSRVFRNPLYLRVEDVPEAALLAGDQQARLGGLAAAGRRLGAGALIDRPAVAALKDEALRLCFAALPAAPQRLAAFRAWQAATPGVQAWATFCALQDARPGDWRAWPAAYRHPAGPAVARFHAEHPAEVDYHAWLQWLLAQQLDALPPMRVGVVGDLAVGVDPAGFDAWSFQDVLAGGVTVGAPPDAFGPHGQDWQLRAFAPGRLAASGYAPFLQTVRAGMAHVAGLRIDHVMGLFRLFWIPEGRPPTEGTFVRYPADDLLGLLALESTRAQALVIGEDLGTVEPGVRERLASHDILSYRLAWFERSPDDTGPRRAADYPRLAVAAVTTHDLPTAAGFFSGADLAHQRDIGVITPERLDEALATHERATHELRGLLEAEGLLDRSVDDLGEVVAALYAFLARTPCMLVAATLEDAVGAVDRPNVPGTIDERPNWSLPLPVAVEDLAADPRVRHLVEILRTVR